MLFPKFLYYFRHVSEKKMKNMNKFQIIVFKKKNLILF